MDGQLLPYDGYVEINVKFRGSGLSDTDSRVKGLFMVVSPRPYNTEVPILIGTNILSALMACEQKCFGVNFLQKPKMITPIYLAFRCIVLQERELVRYNHCLAKVWLHSDEPVVVFSNTRIDLDAYTDKGLPFPAICALLQATEGSAL